MKISVIIPCFNEKDYIENCLHSVYECIAADSIFTYEIIVADGGSDDGTLDILYKLQSLNPFHILHNEKKKQVYALNEMIRKCTGDFIVRCDAHAIYPVGYFSGLVSYLMTHVDVWNVGYRVVTLPSGNGLFARSISIALGSKFGVGSSHRSNTSSEPIECDTVLFGAWEKTVFDRVGLFDETFIRGQDLEHNLRIVQHGGKVVQLPGLQFTYYGRSDLLKFFKMMMQYSSVKPFLFKKHGVFPNKRSFVPIAFYLTVIFLMLYQFEIGLSVFVFYFTAALLYSTYEARKIGLKYVIPLLICFLLQHFAHAVGWLFGLSAFFKRNVDWDATR